MGFHVYSCEKVGPAKYIYFGCILRMKLRLWKLIALKLPVLAYPWNIFIELRGTCTPIQRPLIICHVL